MPTRWQTAPRAHLSIRTFSAGFARQALLGLLIVTFLASGEAGGTEDAAAIPQFVTTDGIDFKLDGKPYFITGANNHYLTYGTDAEVIRVLDDAAALGMNVIRTFLQPVIGSLDGSAPTIWQWQTRVATSDLNTNGNYLLFWDQKTGRMAINDGKDGIQRVDFLIAEAKKRNIKLIIALVDFWSFTGGIQQMRAWYGSQDKSTFFFEDPRTRQDYKDWVSHVVWRLNPRTGLRYRDDPTIMAWELANEANAVPEQLRLRWTAEMAAYLKSQDPNHLVGSGNANPDLASFDISVPDIDFGTWHGYPKYLDINPDQFAILIKRYCDAAPIHGKPVLLEEFGYARSNPDQAAAYEKWLNALAQNRNCAGWLVWRLVSRQQNGKYPVDENPIAQFDLRNDGTPLWSVLKKAVEAGRQ
jgi:mannan endo-1,4-beta-mannosidase